MEGTLDPPGGVTTPKIKKNVVGHVTSIESSWKALFKYVDQMLIWPLIWPPGAENDREIVFLITVLFKGAHVHTEWDRKPIFDMDIVSDLYFHIFNQNLVGGGSYLIPKMGNQPKC